MTIRFLPVLPLLLLAGVACAGDSIPPKQVFAALGAPAHPKVPMSWDRFLDVDGLGTAMEKIHDAYPDLTRLVEVGKSVQGRPILALEVTNYKAGDPGKKPGMYIDGNIHGNEVQAAETVLYTGWYLTEMHGKVDRVTELLNDRVLYLVPTINPDGRDWWFHHPSTPHDSRGGLIPVDEDGDGRADEDGTDDLDGDGQITQMRIKDPFGRYRKDPEFPDYVMQEVQADEQGEYTLLGFEGIDNDGDGQVNEDEPGGYDPNRNWPWDWQPEGIQYGAKEYPLCLPETRAVAAYIESHPNIAGMQSYHNAAGMILRSPGREGGTMEPADETVLREIGSRGEQILPGYRSLITWKDLYTVWGGEFDWGYGALGLVGYTNELWTGWNLYRRESKPGEGDREEARFIRYLLQDQGLTKWHEVDHPTYGKIEVGGMAKNWGRVPPAFMLQEELHRNMAFSLFHAESLALVRIGDVEVKQLNPGLARVRVTLENKGLAPTRLAHDVKAHLSQSDRVTVQGSGLKVIASGLVEDRYFNKVRYQKIRPEKLLLDSVPANSQTIVEFLIEGSGKAKVTFESNHGGTCSKEARVGG